MKRMNKTIISLLIGLLCMPCMVAAETSKELEEAIEEYKKETSKLFDSNDTVAYPQLIDKLMDLCLQANNEDLYYKSWSNLATFTFRFDAQKALKLSDEMRDYATEHDSKFGIVTAIYTEANMLVKVGMYDQAAQLCQEAIEYKNRYLPKVNCTHIYWMLAKIYLVKAQRQEALDALEKCLKEPDLTPYQRMNIFAYKCEAAFCQEPIDSALFMANYTELQNMKKETGKTSEFFTSQDIHYYELIGQYDKVLELARQKPDRQLRLNTIYKAYQRMGRWKEAFDTLNLYVIGRDSLRSAEIHKQIEFRSLELQTARAENEAQTLRLEKQQFTFVALILGILALAVFFVLHMWSRHRAAIRLAEVKAEQERMESELSIARNIQMSMVPSKFPQREGLDMYAVMATAKEVGGDLYGYQLHDNKLYFCIGDVSGKGVPASLFMAQVVRLFRTLATQHLMPAEICSRINDAMSGEDNPRCVFVTLFLGLLDLDTGHLDYCNAGHNYPVIDVGSDRCRRLEVEPDLAIGVMPDVPYKNEEIDSIKGRPLFIYTDGLNEAENKDCELFGNERMLAFLQKTDAKDARQLIDTMTAEVEVYRNGAEPSDDLTMMTIYLK